MLPDRVQTLIPGLSHRHQSLILHWPLLQRGLGGGGAEMLLIRLNCLQNAPPPWWWWSILEYLVTSLCLCPLVTLSLYGAQVYLFLPAEIICIHSQYFKQFSCQIRFADPGKFSISKTNMHNEHISDQGVDGRGKFRFLTQVLSLCKLLSSSQCPSIPWCRLAPASRGFLNFPPEQTLSPGLTPGPRLRDIVVMTMQTIQIALSGRLPVYWNSRGLWRRYELSPGLRQYAPMFLCLEDLPRS